MTTGTGDRLVFAASGGVRTAYRIAGEGPLLILVHGAEADHTMFLGLIDQLSRDFTVVAYDQRDSGQTENGDSPYALDELADDAAGLIRHLIASGVGSRAHLYGTSFGGQIAQVVMARHAGLLDRVVLGSTWRVGRTPLEFNPAVVGELMRLRALATPDAATVASFFLTAEHLHAHPAAIDMFRQSKRTEGQRLRRAHMMQAPAPDIDLTAFSGPVLLLAGGADRLVPPSVTFELAEHLPDTARCELDGLPHIVAIESPGRVAAAIRTFLRK